MQRWSLTMEGPRREGCGRRAWGAVGDAGDSQSDHCPVAVCPLLSQVRPEGEREWVDAEPVPGGIVVNTGNMLASESSADGAEPFYRAVCHRVVRVDDRATRFSMPFFWSREGHRTGEC
jgi:hypothetical protein